MLGKTLEICTKLLYSAALAVWMLIALVLGGLVEIVHSHSIYTGIYPNGTLTPDKQNESTCCGDYDCEPLEASEIEVRDGIVAMYSKRHKVWVKVSEDRVTWGDIVTDKSNAAGHWCGRTKYSYEGVVDFQPDEAFHTYCAFVRPGGV